MNFVIGPWAFPRFRLKSVTKLAGESGPTARLGGVLVFFPLLYRGRLDAASLILMVTRMATIRPFVPRYFGVFREVSEAGQLRRKCLNLRGERWCAHQDSNLRPLPCEGSVLAN